MKHKVLSRVENQLKAYQNDHHGESPLYIIVPIEDGDQLLAEVKDREHYTADVPLTTFKGSKIITHDHLKPGEIRLTNELPDTGS